MLSLPHYLKLVLINYRSVALNKYPYFFDMNKPLRSIFNLFITVFVLLSLLNPLSLFAQSKGIIQGKVVTNSNQPADNVSIGLEGTGYGAATKADGTYSFKAPAGSYTIIISYVGVERVEIPVTVTAGQATTVPDITVRASQSKDPECEPD